MLSPGVTMLVTVGFSPAVLVPDGAAILTASRPYSIITRMPAGTPFGHVVIAKKHS